jgi:hypothetical protein
MQSVAGSTPPTSFLDRTRLHFAERHARSSVAASADQQSANPRSDQSERGAKSSARRHSSKPCVRRSPRDCILNCLIEVRIRTLRTSRFVEYLTDLWRESIGIVVQPLGGKS